MVRKPFIDNSAPMRTCLLFSLLASCSFTYAVEDRPWGLSASFAAGYSDNVPLESEDDSRSYEGDTESPNLGFSMQGNYRLLKAGLWKLGLNGALYTNINTNNDVEDYDRTTFIPGLNMLRTFFWGARSTKWQTSLSHRKDELGGDSYSRISQLSTGLDYARQTGINSNLTLNIAHKDFKNEGADSDITSRDATRYQLSLGESYRLPSLQTLRWAYSYRYNRADGENFDYSGHGFSLSYSRPLLHPVIQLQLGINANTSDYDNHQSSPKREQESWGVFLGISSPLSRSFSVSSRYSYQRLNGNSERFDSERNTLSIGVKYKF